MIKNEQYIYKNYVIDIYKKCDEYTFKCIHRETLYLLSAGLNGFKTWDSALWKAKRFIDKVER